MCGIAGVAGVADSDGRAQVGRMCGALRHRGPDDEGFYSACGVTLGSRRLSIIDLAGGHQPVHNEDSTIWVVQNGEIYNHLELRAELLRAGHRFYSQSDTEALVHGYEEWGEAFVDRLNGMFALAVLDLSRRLLFLARDRMGIKPLFYAVAGQRLVFASELKALLCDATLRREIDLGALDRYLALCRGPGATGLPRSPPKKPPLRRRGAASKNIAKSCGLWFANRCEWN